MGKPNDTSATPATGTSALPAAMMAVSPVAARAWLSFMSESARFLTKRLQQDLNTQKAMLACKSPAELLGVQADFLKTAMDQYSDYATRLYETMTPATADAIQNMRIGPSRRYDDVPF